jgi:hypothetical protein
MMTVYVDAVFIPYGRMKMCHMIADTEDELHAMADKIGLKREWFQGGSKPHYDVSKGKRIEAIRHGAIEVTVRELIALLKGEK